MINSNSDGNDSNSRMSESTAARGAREADLDAAPAPFEEASDAGARPAPPPSRGRPQEAREADEALSGQRGGRAVQRLLQRAGDEACRGYERLSRAGLPRPRADGEAPEDAESRHLGLQGLQSFGRLRQQTVSGLQQQRRAAIRERLAEDQEASEAPERPPFQALGGREAGREAGREDSSVASGGSGRPAAGEPPTGCAPARKRRLPEVPRLRSRFRDQRVILGDRWRADNDDNDDDTTTTTNNNNNNNDNHRINDNNIDIKK